MYELKNNYFKVYIGQFYYLSNFFRIFAMIKSLTWLWYQTFNFTFNLEEQNFYVRVICCFGQYIKGFEVGLHFDSPLLHDLVETFVSLNKIGWDALQIVEYESNKDAGTRLWGMIDANQRKNLMWI